MAPGRQMVANAPILRCFEMLLTFWLGHVLRATGAGICLATQPPKVLRNCGAFDHVTVFRDFSTSRISIFFYFLSLLWLFPKLLLHPCP